MATATVTSKGQVTIPAALRQQLGIERGDRLLFAVEDGTLRVRVVKRRKLSDFYGILPATHPYPGMEVIREEAGRELGRALLQRLERGEADSDA
jgi:AbrB family looped-hinge helix DNA binding protein